MDAKIRRRLTRSSVGSAVAANQCTNLNGSGGFSRNHVVETAKVQRDEIRTGIYGSHQDKKKKG